MTSVGRGEVALGEVIGVARGRNPSITGLARGGLSAPLADLGAWTMESPASLSPLAVNPSINLNDPLLRSPEP